MIDDNKPPQLPTIQHRSGRTTTQFDLSLIQKSKTIQSDQWEILNRVKKSLEGNVFNTFFASSLANLPNYKTPQELAKALAEQFIQKELIQQRTAKSNVKLTLPPTIQHNDSLPSIKTPQLSANKVDRRVIRSQSKDQETRRELKRQKLLKEKEREKELEAQLERRKLQRQLKKEQEKELEKDSPRPDRNELAMMKIEPKIMKLVQKPKPQIQQIKLPSFIEPSFIYTYYLGTGNNHELVKRVMDSRTEWHQTTHVTRANMKWQQSYHGYKYFKLNQHKSHRELVNHFEFHPEVSNKKNLLYNLTLACDATQTDLFQITPVTFAIDFNDPTVEASLSSFFTFFNKNAPPSKQLSKTDAQAKMQEIKKKLRIGPSKDRKNVDYTMRDTFLGPDYLWLLKPTGLNRGRGIHVFNDIDKLVDLLIEYQYGYQEKQTETFKDENGQTQTKTVSYIIKTPAFVIQKYIEKPLLIRNKKFDIRVWVMLSSDLACYFFKEGYIRTASEDYSTNDTENQFIHLTNNAIQKYSDKYGVEEDGNQMSFDNVQDLFRQQINFREQVVEKMKQQSYFAMNSVAGKINKNNRKFCSEIFGFDFILDQDFNMYLIEINTNPCIEESSPLLQMLLPRMLDDGFALTLDQLFPIQRSAQSQYPVSNYSDEENMWELLGELKEFQTQ